MKTPTSHNRKFIILCLFLASFFSFGWSDNWQSIKDQTKKTNSISATFVQEKHLKILTKPLISKGSLYFRAPGSLRWEYTSPIQTVLLMHQGKIKRYYKKNDKFIEDSGANLQAMQVVLLEISNWLKGNFNENPDFTAHLKKGGKILLTPKKKELSTIISRIELILSAKPGIIESVTIYESEDSLTRLEFTDTKLNEKLKDSLFLEIE